jgi:hypothetical protein
MTIRQYLQAKASTFVWLVSSFGILALGFSFSDLIATPFGFPAVLALFVTLLLIVVVLAARFRCPKCSGPLSSLIAHFGPLRRLGRQVQCCPFCGVKMDEPLKV